jgi:hypothetical protein
MNKLFSFEQFSSQKAQQAAAVVQEEQNAKRSSSANKFKTLLAEYGVVALDELTEEQRTEFFDKLRGAEVNESMITEATRSQFGKIDKTGKITSVYVHSDGYPEYMTNIVTNYKGKDVDTILTLGKAGISFLDKKIGDAPMDFNNPTKGVTRFYGRDRGETGNMESKGDIKNIKKYLKDVANNSSAEYVYLYDERDGNWYMADTYEDKELKPVNESAITEGVTLSLVDPNTNKFIKTLSLDIIYREAEKEIETLNRKLSSSQKAKGLYWKVTSIGESIVNEAEIKSDAEFKEYAFTVLKKAFGADFDEAKAQDVVDGILKKCDGDYGACVGILTSSLGESVVTEGFDVGDNVSILSKSTKKPFDSGVVVRIQKDGGIVVNNTKTFSSEVVLDAKDLVKESVVTEGKGFKETEYLSAFLEEIDGMPEAQIRKIMGKDYIDTPGNYAEEAEDYDNDIEDYMTSNMGKKEFEKLVSYWKNNVKESVVTEKFDANYWEDYHDSGESGKIENPTGTQLQQEVSGCVEDWNDNNEDGPDNEVTPAGEKKVLKLAKEFVKAKGYISSDIIDAMIAQES